MVSAVFSYKQILAQWKSLPGIKKVGSKIYFRTISGNWLEMKKNDLIWHRGKGRWSRVTPSIDVKRPAKHIPNEKRWKVHRHMFDLNGSKI